MPRPVLPLTDTKIKNEKPKNKPHFLFDGGGLFLAVMPKGGKLWRFKFRWEGKEKVLSLGKYPEISLAQARDLREKARKLLAVGTDPCAEKKAKKQAAKNVVDGADPSCFERVARAWHKMQNDHSAWDPDHSAKKISKLEKDLFPWLGNRPIAEIEPPELLKHIFRVKERGALEGAHRLLYDCGKIWAYAIGHGWATSNPAVLLKGVLPAVKKKHYPAVTNPEDLAPLLRSIDAYTGSVVVKAALQLAPLVFLRPGELRGAEWSEFNFSSGLWEIPGPRMKMKVPHVVPISRQAMSIFKDLYLLTGKGKFVFPSVRTPERCISENTLNSALRTLGWTSDQVVCHGFRATARTILAEVLEVRVDIIEHQLAHLVKDPNGTAYNRTKFLKQRVAIMQRWADYLDELKSHVGIPATATLSNHPAEIVGVEG